MTPPDARMTAERLAEIRKIAACVPFVDGDAGVPETQQAFADLIAEVERLRRVAPEPGGEAANLLIEAAALLRLGNYGHTDRVHRVALLARIDAYLARLAAGGEQHGR